MTFTVPNFNLDVNIWDNPPVPPAAFSRAVKGNLAWGKRVSSYQGLFTTTEALLMTLLLPPGTDIRGPAQSTSGSVVEVPAGTGRFYHVTAVDDIGKGFPNEHRAAVCAATQDFGVWPTPYP